jgi:hypothetical protein
MIDAVGFHLSTPRFVQQAPAAFAAGSILEIAGMRRSAASPMISFAASANGRLRRRQPDSVQGQD